MVKATEGQYHQAVARFSRLICSQTYKMSLSSDIHFFFLFKGFVYSFERERERESAQAEGVAGRRRGSREPNEGLDSRTLGS